MKVKVFFLEPLTSFKVCLSQMKASEIGTLESHLVSSESQTEIELRGRGSLAYVRTGFRISEYLSGLLVPPTGEGQSSMKPSEIPDNLGDNPLRNPFGKTA